MSKGQVGQKGNRGTDQGSQPKGSQPQKEKQNRRGIMQGGQKGNQSGQQGSQRDQLDDQGRQRHMGHGDQSVQKDGQGRGRPLEEGDQNEELGRPVRVGQENPRGEENDDPQGQWDDKTEGTSRQSGPVR
jgi:hypothetical protein